SSAPPRSHPVSADCARTLHISPSLFSHVAAPPQIYTLSLHDALPISAVPGRADRRAGHRGPAVAVGGAARAQAAGPHRLLHHPRSEEHTSELQSHLNLVCRLLLEKKKKKTQKHNGNESEKDESRLT